MASCHRQALLEAPVESIWELVGDPSRHPQWWPRVVEVNGERFDTGDEYVQITRTPFGIKHRTTMLVAELDDLHELEMRCLTTGTYARWQLTPAQDGTFVDVELGMDPRGVGNRAFDRLAGRPYFRRWTEQSLEALKQAVRPVSP